MAKIEKFFKKGKKLLNKRLFKEAISTFNKCLELDPNSGEILVNLAHAYNQLEEYDKAIDACNKALELNPGLKIAMNNLFYAFDKKEEYDKALHIFEKYLQLYDIKTLSMEQKFTFKKTGIIPMKLDQINHIKNLPKAFNDDPSHYIDNIYQLSLRFSKINESNKKIDALKLILEKNPNKIDTWVVLGNTYLELEDLENAKLTFLKALEIEEDIFPALIGLAQFYTILEDYENAKIFYKKSLDVFSEINPFIKFSSQVDIAWNNLGVCYLKLNKFDKAINALNNALEINPNLKFSWIHLGKIYYQKSNYKKALKCVEKALEIDPTFEKAKILKNKILSIII